MKPFDILLCILIMYFKIIILFIWMIYRNRKVAEFRQWIYDQCLKWSLKEIWGDEYFKEIDSPHVWYLPKLPSYEKMLYSFKPLKVKYWMPQELNNRLFD